MSEMYFEDHPTDPDKVIIRKHPRLDQGPDYERGFIDGMQEQMKRSVDRAVNAMAKREWVDLADDERIDIRTRVQKYTPLDSVKYGEAIQRATEAILKEKNT